MPYEFKFPDVGEGITEGELIQWLVKENDHVTLDQPIVEVETDKAVVKIPSPVTGTILKLYFKEHDTIKVGQVFVTLAQENEVVARPVAQAAPMPMQASPPQNPVEKKKSFGVVGELEEAPDEQPAFQAVETAHQKEMLRVLATPAARKLARDLNVNIAKVQGTGPTGYITDADVRRYDQLRKDMLNHIAPKAPEKPLEQDAQSSQPESMPQEVRVQSTRKYDDYGHIEHVPFRSIRKATAKKLVMSWNKIPHVTHMDEADVTELVKIREKEKILAEKQGIKLTYLPFVIKAVIAAMKEGNPYLNATLDEEHDDIILKKYYNIGFAVDTPDGLLVPVVKGADEKSILDIAKEIQSLAQVAKDRKIDLGDLKGGAFTITNVGSLGGIFATPVINYPEAAILAIGRIREKPVIVNKQLRTRWYLPLSLTFDHRILDGAAAARFMNALKEHLEDPSLLLLERD